MLTSTILSNINHLFVYSYIYAICIFFQTIHLLDVWRHLNKLQSLWSMLEDTYRVSTRWWFSIIIDYWYLFKKYSYYVINTYSFFYCRCYISIHTDIVLHDGIKFAVVARAEELNRVIWCTTLKFWRLKFYSKIYAWVHN